MLLKKVSAYIKSAFTIKSNTNPFSIKDLSYMISFQIDKTDDISTVHTICCSKFRLITKKICMNENTI